MIFAAIFRKPQFICLGKRRFVVTSLMAALTRWFESPYVGVAAILYSGRAWADTADVASQKHLSIGGCSYSGKGNAVANWSYTDIEKTVTCSGGRCHLHKLAEYGPAKSDRAEPRGQLDTREQIQPVACGNDSEFRLAQSTPAPCQGTATETASSPVSSSIGYLTLTRASSQCTEHEMGQHEFPADATSPCSGYAGDTDRRLNADRSRDYSNVAGRSRAIHCY